MLRTTALVSEISTETSEAHLTKSCRTPILTLLVENRKACFIRKQMMKS
jgi:hypothetical protein